MLFSFIMKCKTIGCGGAGKLLKSGGHQFPKGYCNSCYQKNARANDGRIAPYYKMVNRCSNPRNDSYKDYGGRGIRVALDWLPKNNGFKNFCRDMGERPEGMTLDRINPNGPYSADNCRWASTWVQNNNQRQTRTKTEDTFYKDLFRGVTFRKYKYKNGKRYLNHHKHWCASLWVGGVRHRQYCDSQESAIEARLRFEITLLGHILA